MDDPLIERVRDEISAYGRICDPTWGDLLRGSGRVNDEELRVLLDALDARSAPGTASSASMPPHVATHERWSEAVATCALLAFEPPASAGGALLTRAI